MIGRLFRRTLLVACPANAIQRRNLTVKVVVSFAVQFLSSFALVGDDFSLAATIGCSSIPTYTSASEVIVSYVLNLS
jgi:hypothetical protein